MQSSLEIYQNDRYYSTPYGLIGVAFRASSAQGTPYRLCVFDKSYNFKGYLTSDRYADYNEALLRLDDYADEYKYRIHFRNEDAILKAHRTGMSCRASGGR